MAVRDRDLAVPLQLVYDQGTPVPGWMRDGYASREDYERKTVALVRDCYAESKERYAKDKLKWKRADKLVELEHILDWAAGADPSDTRLPIILQLIEEYLSSRLDEELIPSGVSRERAMDPLVQALNYQKDEILDDCRFAFLKMRKRLDQLRYRISFFYCAVDPREDGLFGVPGRHIIDRIDPRCVWPDAYAEDWRFDKMRYLIIARPMDITDIARCWPDKAGKILSDPNLSGPSRSPEEHQEQDVGAGSVVYQGEQALGYNIGSRERALVLECYIRDGRVKKMPRGYHPDGTPWRNDDGEVIAKYVDRYPHGRKIVICGKVLLEDKENPYCEAPIVAFPEVPYPGLFSFSPVEALDIIDKKINKLASSAFNNLLVNMNSPLLLSNKAFLKPSQYNNVEVKEGAVWTVRDNTTVRRLEPGVLPPETLPVINFFRSCADAILGTTDVSRGNLEAGTEVSGQTVQDLQAAQMKRVRLKGECDKEGMQQLGKQLFYNIRKWNPSSLEFKMKNPTTGEDMNLRWDSGEWKNEWVLKVEVASSSPGAKQSFEQQAVLLTKEGITDPQYARDALKIPPEVSQRIEQRRTELAELGLVKEAMDYPKIKKTPGRRSQTPLV